MPRLRTLLLIVASVALVIAPATQASSEPGPPFTLNIFPSDEPVLSHPAFIDQRVNFLVSLEDSDPSAGPIRITVKVSDRKATVRMVPSELTAGQVGELTVIPHKPRPGYDEDRMLIEITGRRQGWVSRDWRTLSVTNAYDLSMDAAREKLALFTPWLEATHPELGITAETEWDATVVAPVLIVSHYLFFTPELELGLVWHNTWGGEWDDWAAIYVRPRWTDWSPILAAKIDSVEHGSPVHEIAPPAEVMRTTDFMMWGPPDGGH